MVIGITESDSKFHLYEPWIKGENNEDIQVITLSYRNLNIEEVEKCQGIVLSGGIDTHPKYYHSTRLNYPGSPGTFNEARDEFELAVFKKALAKGVPVLAICRGMQLVNVALEGDLVQDLEEKGHNDHKKQGEEDGRHLVQLVPGSLFHQVCGVTEGTVNSAHHQGLGTIAPGLVVSAFSPDQVPEAIEWKEPLGRSFLLGVQWHPERDQPGNPFSDPIRDAFLKAAIEHKAYISL